jgi:hypothetical protein
MNFWPAEDLLQVLKWVNSLPISWAQLVPLFAMTPTMHLALSGSILPDVMRSLVLLLLLIFGLAPGAQARSQRRASRPHSSRHTKSKKGKRNRKPPIYDENGRRKN